MLFSLYLENVLKMKYLFVERDIGSREIIYWNYKSEEIQFSYHKKWKQMFSAKTDIDLLLEFRFQIIY